MARTGAKTTVLADEPLDERVVRRVFPSGLTVYAVQKPEFTKSYATVGIRYGSVDETLPGNGRSVSLPEGIAHFLEHKVFETPEGDAFDLFASKGASANAFTSFSSTRYLFGTSSDFPGNLRVLLDMVFDLYVTDENVEKEKGIIGQEIAMYRDNADWRIFFNALEALYKRHPVRIDIAGTEKTIARIAPDLLRKVHASYYHPGNMVLSAVTPEPPEVVFAAVAERVEARKFPAKPARRGAAPSEPETVARSRVRLALTVSRPRVLLATKDVPPARGGVALLRREIVSTLALDCLFGNSGSIYLALYESGLLDESFAYSYTADVGYAFAMAGGETDDEKVLEEALQREIDAALEHGLTDEDVRRVKNKALGEYARVFNSPSSIAQMLASHHLRGTTISDYRTVLSRVTRRELERRLRELLAPGRRIYSVVVPK